MKQIKAFIFRNNDSDKNVTVVLQDCGVASAYNSGECFKTDYYQRKLTSESNFDTMWDELAEGKMYCKSWDGVDARLKENIDDEIIDDMIGWLYISTEKFEIIKIEMGELTEETFKKVKHQMTETKRYIIFTSHNSGGHSLSIHKTPQEVIDELEIIDESEIESIENLKDGESTFIEKPDSTWSTIFYKDIM